MDTVFQHLLLLWYKAYDSVKIYKTDECNVYICGIELVTAVLMKTAFSGIWRLTDWYIRTNFFGVLAASVFTFLWLPWRWWQQVPPNFGTRVSVNIASFPNRVDSF